MKYTGLLLLFCSILACSSDKKQQTTSPPAPTFQVGQYTHNSFHSKHRNTVAYNVYLPPNWSPSKSYPLILLLHGQGEDEHTFLSALPADSLNRWMQQKIIPEMVLVALRGGDNTNEMQWYTDNNEYMITSDEAGELRDHCHQQFGTSKEAKKMALIGHSRGATGALNFALYFPTKFSAVVSSAFVSDYAIERLRQATESNLDQILKSPIQIHLLIGSQDQYVLNNHRKGSPTMSAFFKSKGIPHNFETIAGKSHRLSELWASPTNLKYLKRCAASWAE